MAQEEKVSKVSILTNGIIKENPVLRLVLGTCSTLAITTAVSNAIGMGVAFTFVLICSNVIIALLRNGLIHTSLAVLQRLPKEDERRTAGFVTDGQK